KTTDGGATWKQVVKVNDDTGANDLVMSFTDHRVLYASTYQRRRTQCCMNGGGPGSAIWKSTDGGDTWTKLAGRLPAGSLGRIDPGNPDRILLAGVRLTISVDGGRTQISADPLVHDDKHAIWWDPSNSEHMLIGTDGGVYSSYDMSRTWVFNWNLPVGLFYHVG